MEIDNEGRARAFVARSLNSAAVSQIEAFINALHGENVRQNLVANSSLDCIWQRHIADSIQLLSHVSRETGVWIDLGAGAGFPGLIIAIARPKMSVILVESRKKRVHWLNEQVDRLGLANCRVQHTRLEVLSTFPADVISARAFAPLDRLIALAARFSTEATTWVLPKGRSAAQEVAMLPHLMRDMFHVEQSLTDKGAGIVIGQGRPRVSEKQK